MRPVFAVLLLSSLSFAQSAPQTTATPAQQPAAPASRPAAGAEKPAELPPTAPVVTIAGFCPGQQATGPECKTEISRAEFERLAKALNPNMPEQVKRQLANAYARLIVVKKLAEERGLMQKPETQEALRFSELQMLAQLFARDIQEEAAKISSADIDKYYKEHAAQYEQASLERIFIPKSPPNAKDKVDDAAVKAEGAKIQALAKAPGAEFAKLQKQAYDDLKITASPPPVELKDMRRDSYPPGQAKVFDLAVGQVSEALDEPAGIYIYKVTAKKTLTLPEVEADIRKGIEQQRVQSEMQKLTANIEPKLNDAYFGGSEGERPQPPQLQAPPATAPKTAPPAKAPAAAPKSTPAPKTPK